MRVVLVILCILALAIACENRERISKLEQVMKSHMAAVEESRDVQVD